MDTNIKIKISLLQVKGIGPVRHWGKLGAALVACLLVFFSPFVVPSGWGWKLEVPPDLTWEVGGRCPEFAAAGSIDWWVDPHDATISNLSCSGFPPEYVSTGGYPVNLLSWSLTANCGGLPAGSPGTYIITCTLDGSLGSITLKSSITVAPAPPSPSPSPPRDFRIEE